MAIYPKVNGEYKEMSDCNVKVAGSWKKAATIFTKVNGVWKEACADVVEFGTSVFHEWTESGTQTDRYSEITSNGVRFISVDMNAYDANGARIAQEGNTGANWRNYTTTLKNSSTTFADVNISVVSSKIRYTVTIRPNTACKKVTISVGQILKL